MCTSLANLGHEVVYVGWDRTPDRKKDINHRPEVKLRILRRAGAFGKNSWDGWGAYYRHVVSSLYEERPDAVQSMNEDTAALVLPFKRLLYRYLIEDIHDSVIANRFRSWWLDEAARMCRWLGNAAADCIIETGPELQSMLGGFARKSIVIENAPYDPGPEVAAQVPTSGPIRLHLGGYLSKRRMGLETLLAAIDLLPAGTVTVEASGWLMDDYAKDVFAKHPAVNYRWLAKPIDFLKCAGGCDALLYLRSDAGESPYRAAVRPNRIFDALAVGRPLIVNAELTIAKWVQEENLGIVLPQFDAHSLAGACQSLIARRATLPQEAVRLRRIFLDGHVWPVMEQRLGALYERLCSPGMQPEVSSVPLQEDLRVR